jgi:CubicO group peptidase (beta-lactamase class C family)
MNHPRFEPAVRAGFLFLMLFAGACGGSGGESPSAAVYRYATPEDLGDGWSVASATSQGVAVTVLEDGMQAIGAGLFPALDSIVIARNGQLVFEETIRTRTDSEDSRVGNTNPAMHAQFSVTKGVAAIAVGIAIDQGYIGDVDTPFLSFFDYAAYANWDDAKHDITLGHVLAMRLGLAWNEWDPPYTSNENQLIRLYQDETDYSKALLDLPLSTEPGAAFAYNTVATIALAQAIENRAPLSFVDFGLTSLLQPLGITEVEFLTTPTGLPNVGGGFYFHTRDVAKFGQLMLDGGSWQTQRVVSQSWVDAMLEVHSAVGWANPGEHAWQIDGYGYQWWLGHYDYEGNIYDTWVMWGFGGQWVVVMPELGIVVAINSHGYGGSNEAQEQAHEWIVTYLLPSVV